MNNEEYAFRKNLKFMLSQLENVKGEAEVTLHNSSTNGMIHFIIRKGEENYIVLTPKTERQKKCYYLGMLFHDAKAQKYNFIAYSGCAKKYEKLQSQVEWFFNRIQEPYFPERVAINMVVMEGLNA